MGAYSTVIVPPPPTASNYLLQSYKNVAIFFLSAFLLSEIGGIIGIGGGIRGWTSSIFSTKANSVVRPKAGWLVEANATVPEDAEAPP